MSMMGRSSRRSSRRSRISSMYPMFVACPPNPPYTNYMDELPLITFPQRKRKLSPEEKYDYSDVIKSGKIKCLTSLRYKTLAELDVDPMKWPSKNKALPAQEPEPDCPEDYFVTAPTKFQSVAALRRSMSKASDSDFPLPDGSEEISPSHIQSITWKRGSDQDGAEAAVVAAAAAEQEPSSLPQYSTQQQTLPSFQTQGESEQEGQATADWSTATLPTTTSLPPDKQGSPTEFVCCICQERFLCSKVEPAQAC